MVGNVYFSLRIAFFMYFLSKIINKKLYGPTTEDLSKMNANHEKNLTIKLNKVFTGRSGTTV